MHQSVNIICVDISTLSDMNLMLHQLSCNTFYCTTHFNAKCGIAIVMLFVCYVRVL